MLAVRVRKYVLTVRDHLGSYEKFGFRRVGVMRKAARNRATGEWKDELLMELVV